jgi:lipopolysaccharide export system protein LptA
MRESVLMIRAALCLAMALVLGFALTSAAAVNSYLFLGKGSANGADQPLDITGRKLTFSFGDGSVEAAYLGNVKVKQGDVTMTCDRLVVDYQHKDAKRGQERQNARLARDAQKMDNIRSITALGNVRIVQGDRIAVAGKAVFGRDKRTIELTDNPMLWQGSDRLIGQRIVFDLDKDRAEVNGGVSVTISSGSAKKATAK